MMFSFFSERNVICCRHEDTADRERKHANDQRPLPPTEEVLWSEEPHSRTEGMLR